MEMKMKFLTKVIAIVLLAQNSFAATAQVNNVLQFPNITLPFSQIGKLRNLVAGSSGPTANNYFILANTMSPGSTTQYQVASGKTLVCFGFYSVNGSASTAADSLRFLYGTAALSGDNTSSAPTGVVYLAGSTSNSSIGHRIVGGNVYNYFPTPISFPANSYPAVQFGNTDTFGISMPCEECVPGTDC
jgi:hypothetical protein